MPKNKPSPASSMAGWGERGLIRWLLPRLRRQSANRFRVFPGDDAAVLSPSPGHVLSIDGLAEGTHFRQSWESRLRPYGLSLGRALGWKLLGSSLSDLAAMGRVERRWAMIYVGAPGNLPKQFLKDFFKGLQESAAKNECALAGGDTVRSETLNLVAAVGGTLVSRRVLTRAGAKAGDDLCVIGPVGDASAGLNVLEKKLKLPMPASRHLIRQFFNVKPLFHAGDVLSKYPGVTALLDLSDPFVESVDLLLGKKSLGCSVNLNLLPRSAVFRKFGLEKKYSLSEGEDYGFLFSLSPRAVASLRKKLSFHIVGKITSAGERMFLMKGRPISRPRPFQHFQ